MQFIRDKRTELIASVIIVILVFMLKINSWQHIAVALFCTLPFIWKLDILGGISLGTYIVFEIFRYFYYLNPENNQTDGSYIYFILIAIIFGIAIQIALPKLIAKKK